MPPQASKNDRLNMYRRWRYAHIERVLTHGVDYGYVCSKPCARRLRAWHRLGVSYDQLALQLGLSPRTVEWIITGRRASVLCRTHFAIMNVPIRSIKPCVDVSIKGRLDATIAREHIHCLDWRGMLGTEIARRAGITPTHVIRIRDGRTKLITKRVHKAILDIPIPPERKPNYKRGARMHKLVATGEVA